MSLSTWAWYRSRQQTTDQEAAAMAANTGNIHGLGVENGNGNAQAKDGKDKKSPESLFGPNIGVISGGPSWTASTEKKMLKDELTMDVVKTWIEKSKEPSQPTTTLQALVNLKRPTLRLSPLVADSEQPEESHSQHALEFEYDCDAPKCGIYVNVLLPPGHPEHPGTETSTDAPPSTSSKPRYAKVLVFESVVEGGFGKVLKLDEGAVLDLGRYEWHKGRAGSASAPKQKENVTEQGTQDTGGATNSGNGSRNHGRRRITHIFRRRRNGVAVSGPALAVVDASSPPAGNDGNNPAPAPSSEKKKDDSDDGVKVTIRLVALDEQGTELESPNEQVTYLSVERFGPRVTAERKQTSGVEAPGTDNSEQARTSTDKDVKEDEHIEGVEVEEDSRPWVVKVVKREATIGPHTFQLHEIYGLTSSNASSASSPAPTAPLPNTTHTYPPQQQPAIAADNNDDSTSECLLCLSSPREVVLLPCRHLVACKECALNMVEFGAGGAITQTTAGEDSANPGGDVNNGGADGAAANDGNAQTANGAAAPANPRRKRKAKGWFCPVCRQPYTSLLRITTNPPPAPTSTKEDRTSQSQDEERDVTDAPGVGSGLPLPVTAPAQSTGNGLLSRPTEFFRSLTSRSNTNPNSNGAAAGETGTRRDIENQL